MTGLADHARPLLAEIDEVLARMPGDALDPLLMALAGAQRVLIYGVGRTGLVMQALAVRLHHLGLDAHVVGAMNAPPIGPGDLFLVNASFGHLPTGLALIASAKAAGARVAVITAVPASAAGKAADVLLHLPAQTLADDQGPGAKSRMPMGSQYELALFVIAELIVLRLAETKGVGFPAMRTRHANLL